MPHNKFPSKRLPFFVRVGIGPAMMAVARNLAEIKLEVVNIGSVQGDLQADDLKQQTALTEIAVSGSAAAAKADEVIDRVKKIRYDLRKYLKEAEKER